MQWKYIEVNKDNGVMEIILNRPPLNVLNIEMMRELTQALLDADKDATLKLLLLSGRGKAFSAGVDVGEHHPDRVEEMMESFNGLFFALNRVEAPSIALVRGAALGGGCELALFCDMLLASDKAKFGQPEVKVGFFPPIAAAILPRLVGRSRAMEICVTGRMVTADEALRWGLVNRLFPEETFDQEVKKYVDELLSSSPLILRFNKRAIDYGHALPFKTGYEKINQLFLRELMKTEDVREGIRSFEEKRKPEWKNR
jgi:cyclohexa-1,5-dienecarbonyl-CoA hydratase